MEAGWESRQKTVGEETGDADSMFISNDERTKREAAKEERDQGCLYLKECILGCKCMPCACMCCTELKSVVLLL